MLHALEQCSSNQTKSGRCLPRMFSKALNSMLFSDAAKVRACARSGRAGGAVSAVLRSTSLQTPCGLFLTSLTQNLIGGVPCQILLGAQTRSM